MSMDPVQVCVCLFVSCRRGMALVSVLSRRAAACHTAPALQLIREGAIRNSLSAGRHRPSVEVGDVFRQKVLPFSFSLVSAVCGCEVGRSWPPARGHPCIVIIRRGRVPSTAIDFMSRCSGGSGQSPSRAWHPTAREWSGAVSRPGCRLLRQARYTCLQPPASRLLRPFAVPWLPAPRQLTTAAVWADDTTWPC